MHPVPSFIEDQWPDEALLLAAAVVAGALLVAAYMLLR
jgi:uncharacterized protein involved in exopolysaccharide biosynthesis